MSDKSVVHSLFNRLLQLKYIISLRLSHGGSAYLLGIPAHPNLGDQAQSMCTCKWLEDNYPSLKIRQFSSIELAWDDYALLRAIAGRLRPDDMIFFQSGYNTSDLYLFEEKMHRRVLELIHGHRIIVLPQTVFFRDVGERKKCADAYTMSDNDVLFLSRDKVSFADASDFMPDKVETRLFPDIVTGLIGRSDLVYSGERHGILLCMRGDRESVISSGERSDIERTLSDIDKVCVTDTNADAHHRLIRRNREKYVFAKIRELSRYRVVITDRYHGLIFALVAGVPVIVLETADHKLSSGLEWFNGVDEYENYVYVCSDIAKLPDTVRMVLAENNRTALSPHFKTSYYDNLAAIIRERGTRPF